MQKGNKRIIFFFSKSQKQTGDATIEMKSPYLVLGVPVINSHDVVATRPPRLGTVKLHNIILRMRTQRHPTQHNNTTVFVEVGGTRAGDDE